MHNLPPDLSERDLDHIYGSREPRCTCGCAFDDHYPEDEKGRSTPTFPCGDCPDCPDYTPEEDPRA